MKQKIQKTIFIIASTIVVIALLGSLTYPLCASNTNYLDYITGYFWFSIQAVFYIAILGSVMLGLQYVIEKLWKRFFC
jgi:hypothetical protein